MLANQTARVECQNKTCQLHFLVKLEPGVRANISKDIIGDRKIHCCIFCCGNEIKIIDLWNPSQNQNIIDS